MTSSLRPAHAGRLAAGVLCAAALLTAMTGCAPNASPTSSANASAPAPTNSQGTSRGSTDAPKNSAPPATASSTPAPPPTPVSMPCSTMLTDKQLYSYNPTVSANPGYSPASALTKQAVAQKGTACGWLYESSNEKIEISVSKPAASVLNTFKDDAAASSRATPAYGNYPKVEGYFAVTGKTGQAQVFTGGYWIVASSTVFFEPGDAAQLVQDVMDNLGVG